MNWLIYIGGGITWAFVPAFIFVIFTGGKSGFTIKGIPLIGWMMIWIWICWKFI